MFESEKRFSSKEYSGVDSERTIQSLRFENASLVKEIERLKASAASTSSVSSSGKER
jgi:hypothetical protein